MTDTQNNEQLAAIASYLEQKVEGLAERKTNIKKHISELVKQDKEFDNTARELAKVSETYKIICNLPKSRDLLGSIGSTMDSIVRSSRRTVALSEGDSYALMILASALRE